MSDEKRQKRKEERGLCKEETTVFDEIRNEERQVKTEAVQMGRTRMAPGGRGHRWE